MNKRAAITYLGLASLGAGILGGGAAASAALLDVELVKPFLVFNSTGVTTYNSSTDIFSATAVGLAVQSSGTTILFPIGSTTIDMSFNVRSNGQLRAGVQGHDLVIVGEVDTDGDTIPEYTGTLLTAEVRRFGFLEAGATDQFDMSFEVTGGSMAGLFADRIGITLTVENSTFNGSFCYGFVGGAKGVVGNLDGNKCPRNLWNWKHSWRDWPRCDLSIGGDTLYAQEIYRVLCGLLPSGACPSDPTTVALAKLLIATKFSFLDGAIVDEDIVEVIAMSDAFLAAHPLGSTLTVDEADEAQALIDALTDYVNTDEGCGSGHGGGRNCHGKNRHRSCGRGHGGGGHGHGGGGHGNGGNCR